MTSGIQPGKWQHLPRSLLLGLLLTTAAPLAAFAQAEPAETDKPASAAIATPLTYGNSYQAPSRHFGEGRRFMVALPERYQASERRYPVLYVIDGDFQFRHVSAAVNNLTRMGKIPPMIVVGVATQGQADYIKSTTWASEREGDEFGGADTMMAYLKDELVPLIDSRFRTSGKNAVAGYSLGGLFTLEALMADNTPFSAFLAMSPSAWYDDYGIKGRMAAYIKKHKSLPPLFLSVANEEGMGVQPLFKLIEKSVPNSGVVFKRYPDETHYSTAMPALLDALEYLAPAYYTDLDVLVPMDNYKDVLNHFEAKRSQWAGFRFEWLQSYYLAKYFFITKQQDKIDSFLDEAQKRFPESNTELCVAMAKAYLKKKQPEEAQKVLLRAQKEGEQSADWLAQMSEAKKAMGAIAEAQALHSRAMALAEAQGLESWEYWELNPRRF
ncbi:alpha/beta hydrolase-fold protein [Shewanella sp. 3B26]|uniref:Alpha/beta hydrolase-fold protein n=1 Tax=Shewanella zhuhaiensis TaxID=2919576 RepID=A0AAJ1EZ37_9GAMM|nr:alpha/beta hydrolase-fold protein [Shewanella zhuhaiensis]MCH4293122.1 alpha/beta hydrolase-fold protein [Shewanella zhuhaiensis]